MDKKKQRMPSIKVNYFFNTGLTVLNILFPLVTSLYISRIFGPEGIGKVGFANSFAGYFIMLAGLGIPVYGIKAIAARRDKQDELNRTFSGLFFLNAFAAVLSMILYLSCFIFVEKMRAEALLFIVVGVSIILNAFSIDWFYQGIENYRYITIRSLIIKAASLILIFLAVRYPGDYVIYAGITVIALSGANIWNMIKVGGYVKIQWKNMEVREHIKPVLILFLAAAIGSIYNILDTVILGFLANYKSVGFYNADRKLTSFTIAFVTSLGAVLIPRLSYYIKNGKKSEYRSLAEKSVNFIYFLSLPLLTGIIGLAPEILNVYGGKKFVEGALSLQLIAPIILITSLDAFVGFQVLIPNNLEKSMTIANVFGAVTNLLINFFFIPYFQQNASSAAIFISETVVLAVQIFLGRKFIQFRMFGINSLNYLAGAVLTGLCIYLIKLFFKNAFLVVGLSLFLSALAYGVFLLIRKDSFIMMIINYIRGIFRPVKNQAA